MKIKIAVIGSGNMSNTVHLPILAKLRDEGLIELALIADINADAAKLSVQKFGFSEFTLKANDIFSRNDINSVYVFGTVSMHYEYGMAALSSGKHLFVEKPSAPDALKAAKLYYKMKEKKLIGAVGFNRRFQVNLNKVKTEIEKTSRVYSMEACFHKSTVGQEVRYGVRSWLGVNGIHSIDALCYLAGGRPTSIYTAKNYSSGESFSALLQFENGTHATLSCNHRGGARSEMYMIHSLETSYLLDGSSRLVEYKDGSFKDETFQESLVNRGFEEEHREFLRAIQGQGKLRNGIEHGIVASHIMALIEDGHNGSINWDELFEEVNLSPIKEENAETTQKTIEGRTSILVLNPSVIKSSLTMLGQKFDIIDIDGIDKLSRDEKEKIVAIIGGRGSEHYTITSELLDSLPNLRVLGVNYVSLKKKNFDPKEILKRNIAIINAADTYAEAVAEFALMQSILGLRNALRSHEVMRKGGYGIGHKVTLKSRLTSFLMKTALHPSLAPLQPMFKKFWRKMKPFLVNNEIGATYKARGGKDMLHGASVGIIGYGSVARAYIKLLKPLNVKIKVYSEYLTNQEAAQYGISKVTLAEALSTNVVSIHRGLSERTKKSFGISEIQSLKPGTVLVNTSRAEIIDTNALVERLKKNDIFACLDVFDEEPLPKNNPFRKLKNVFLTSHISGSTDATYTAADNVIASNIVDYLEGKYTGSCITTVKMIENMS